MKPENFSKEMGEILSSFGKPVKRKDGTPASAAMQVQFNRTYPAPRSRADVLFDKLEQQAMSWTAENASGFTHYSFNCGLLQGEIRKMFGKLAEFEAPSKGGSMETTYAHDGGELVVHFDIDAPDESVGWVGSIDICGVYANGMDIQGLLDNTTITCIEDKCIESAGYALEDAKAERADREQA